MGIILSAIRILATSYMTKTTVNTDSWSEEFMDIIDGNETPEIISYIDDSNYTKTSIIESQSLHDIDLDTLDETCAIEILPD